MKNCKQALKKTSDELQLYFHFRKRGFNVENMKGKGSYRRSPKYIKNPLLDNMKED